MTLLSCTGEEDPINHSPVLVPPADQTVNVGETLALTLEATDPDGDSVEIAMTRAPAGAVLEALSLTWTPEVGDVGAHDFLLSGTDKGVPPLADYAAFTVTVRDPSQTDFNHPPEADDVPDQEVEAGDILELTLSAADPDGDLLTWAAELLPSGASFDAVSATFSWTPSSGNGGTHFAMFRVTDDGTPALSDSVLVRIDVRVPGSGNVSPIFFRVAAPGSTSACVPFSASFEAMDPDGDSISYYSPDLPIGAALSPAGTTTTLDWTPDMSQTGVHLMVIYAVDDGAPTMSDAIIYSIEVAGCDDDPCTDDSCGPSGCVFSFNTAPCDDEDPATVEDTCDGAGTCVGLPDADQDSVADSGHGEACVSGATVGCNDNCAHVANSGQEDADGDGVGDLCDLENGYINAHVWSPDGTRIALIKCPPAQGWNCDIWVADADLTRAHKIYTGADSVNLSGWEDDWLLFRKYTVNGLPDSYDADGEYWKIRTDGTGLAQITFTYTNGVRTEFWNTYYANIGTAIWARFVPGADLVYFQAHNGNGWYRTYLCNADGSDMWSDVSGSYGWSAGISLAGDKLLYGDGSNHNQPVTIYAQNIDGTGATALVSGLQPGLLYMGSPDGASVAYNELGVADRDIRVVSIDGANDHAVTSDAFIDLFNMFMENGSQKGSSATQWQPWSPDGEWLLFGSNRMGNFHVFKIKPDGSGLTQVSDGTTFDFAPSFSPNGRHISYHQLPEGYEESSLLPTELVVESACLGYSDWQNSIVVTGGSINGQALSAAELEIRVAPGETLSGTIDTTVSNLAGQSGWVFPVGATPSWGDHETSYWCQDSWFHLGSGPLTFDVELTAPAAPGTYHIIMAGDYQMDCGDIFSATNWTVPPEIWDDGNDIAGWGTGELKEAMQSGKVCSIWVPGTSSLRLVAAAAIRVIVE